MAPGLEVGPAPAETARYLLISIADRAQRLVYIPQPGEHLGRIMHRPSLAPAALPPSLGYTTHHPNRGRIVAHPNRGHASPRRGLELQLLQ